jgi:iron complex transport system substrate-binding protein
MFFVFRPAPATEGAPSGAFHRTIRSSGSASFCRLSSVARSAIAGVALFWLAACGNPRPGGGAAEEGAASLRQVVPYTDEIGRSVRFPRRPLRIISLAPNVTETLFLLGAADRLIGVTNECDWPEAARRKPRIGDLLNPNYELLLADKPDLIIASTAGNDRGAVMKLAGLGLPVYVTAPRSLDRIMASIKDIGMITDCEGEASKLVAQMNDRLENVKRRLAGLPPTRAFYMTWFDPLLAPGKNTFENDVVRFAGVISITADIDEYYPRYSLEQLIAQDPDVILTVEHQGNPLPDLTKLAGWKTLRAVKEGRVYVLSEYIQHPSPLFVDGVEDLARKLHPERFR